MSITRSAGAAELLCRLAFGRAAAELVGERFASRREGQADRVDAVTLAGRRRAVGEDVALVRAAAGADDLGPDHAVAGVADGREVPLSERLGKARPAGAALELGAAVEQRQAAQAAGEDARPFLVEEYAAERRLGAMLEEDVLLLFGEVGDELLELRVGGRSQVEGGVGGGGHRSSLRVAPNMGMSDSRCAGGSVFCWWDTRRPPRRRPCRRRPRRSPTTPSNMP